MKHFLFILLISISTVGCSSFSPYAKHNQFSHEEGYVKYFNEKLNLKSLTFGDFKFASSNKEFKKINPNEKPIFKNILLYAKTNNPDYEYYIVKDVINLKSTILKSHIINLNDEKITFIISKKSPQYDAEMIKKNIENIKD